MDSWAFQGLKSAASWAAANPRTTTCVSVGVAVIAAPAAASGAVLGVVGFGAGGVQAGTAAAMIHSAIGNVAAGSLFATAQSAAAGGYGMAVASGLAQSGGAVMVAPAMVRGFRATMGKMF